jgi:hypothetical protein
MNDDDSNVLKFRARPEPPKLDAEAIGLELSRYIIERHHDLARRFDAVLALAPVARETAHGRTLVIEDLEAMNAEQQRLGAQLDRVKAMLAGPGAKHG